MILKGLKYSRFEGLPREWKLVGNNGDYAYFSNINLLVGKNAAGKSRTLTIVKEISRLLAKEINLANATYHTQSFDLIYEAISNSDGKDKGERTKYRYILQFVERKVTSEILYIDEKEQFRRDEKGIKLNDLNLSDKEKEVLDNLKEDELVVTMAIENNKQHYMSFVEWGKSLRNYLFADQFEKRALIEDITFMNDPNKSRELTNALLVTFYLGKEQFGDKFVKEITKCMHELGYNEISDIKVHETKGGYCLGVEENGKYMVSQLDMSQGLFRALSLFVFLIYARMKNMSACVLIDDVGEGVDFDRSKALITIMIKQLQGSLIQCFMSTNDRYVMNDIPLRFWSVVDRHYDTSTIYDNVNNHAIYEDFKFTGLNNFEFLTTDFYKEGFGADSEDEEEDEDF